jgi:hypothetical protein
VPSATRAPITGSMIGLVKGARSDGVDAHTMHIDATTPGIELAAGRIVDLPSHDPR